MTSLILVEPSIILDTLIWREKQALLKTEPKLLSKKPGLR